MSGLEIGSVSFLGRLLSQSSVLAPFPGFGPLYMAYLRDPSLLMPCRHLHILFFKYLCVYHVHAWCCYYSRWLQIPWNSGSRQLPCTGWEQNLDLLREQMLLTAEPPIHPQPLHSEKWLTFWLIPPLLSALRGHEEQPQHCANQSQVWSYPE